MLRDNATLLDIAKAATAVVSFVKETNKKAFLADFKTQSATLYQLIVMGEATKRLSAEFREQHPQIPWKLMAGMRNHLVHGYDVIDWDEVWKTATTDVPELLTLLKPILPEEKESN
jgi:uncharacterized protein with HEPN domain